MVTGLGDSSQSKVTFQPGGAKQISEASSLEKEPTMYTNFFFSFFFQETKQPLLDQLERTMSLKMGFSRDEDIEQKYGNQNSFV